MTSIIARLDSPEEKKWARQPTPGKLVPAKKSMFPFTFTRMWVSNSLSFTDYTLVYPCFNFETVFTSSYSLLLLL